MRTKNLLAFLTQAKRDEVDTETRKWILADKSTPLHTIGQPLQSMLVYIMAWHQKKPTPNLPGEMTE